MTCTDSSSAAMASLTSAVNSDPVIARLQKQTKSKNIVIKHKSTPKAKEGKKLKANTNPKPNRASQLANGGKKKSSVENHLQKFIKAQKAILPQPPFMAYTCRVFKKSLGYFFDHFEVF